MKATELRLGNLIKIGGNTLNTYQTYVPTKVTLAILNEIAGENEERPDAELSVFQPIPLTEEWAKKFGLEIERPYAEKEFYEVLFDEDHMFSLILQADPDEERYGEFILYYNCHEYETFVSIKYVHQLQNLYFTLTGEELKIKL